jgi:hypothetical protein
MFANSHNFDEDPDPDPKVKRNRNPENNILFFVERSILRFTMRNQTFCGTNICESVSVPGTNIIIRHGYAYATVGTGTPHAGTVLEINLTYGTIPCNWDRGRSRPCRRLM